MAFNAIWRGASGQSYNFEILPDGALFNDVSGVYIFCRRTPHGVWEALYVGETQSFYDRLNVFIRNHEGYTRSQNVGMTHIAALICTGEAERLRIETDLRHGLKPSQNLQGTPVELFQRPKW